MHVKERTFIVCTCIVIFLYGDRTNSLVKHLKKKNKFISSFVMYTKFLFYFSLSLSSFSQNESHFETLLTSEAVD